MRELTNTLQALSVGIILIFSLATGAQSESEDWSLDGRTAEQRKALMDLEATVSRAIEAQDAPSVAIAFVDANGLIWTTAQGYADTNTRRVATIDTPYGIGSISKTFIGAALMTEIEKGRADLNRSLSDSLPFEVVNPRSTGAQIEVRHIVTHSSGIRDNESIYANSYADGDPDADFGAWLKRYLTPQGDLYKARANFLNNSPGEEQVYSNIAATVGALVVEHAAGKPYRTVVKERLFAPLGMSQTGFMISDFPEATIASPHERNDDQLEPISLFGYPTYPDGQIRSSARDLARYLQMLLNDGRFKGKQVLAKSSIERMFSPVMGESEGDEEVYGVYWPLGENRTAQHSGGDPGILAVAAINRDRGIGFIYLQNTDDQQAIRVLGPKLSAAVKTFPLPAALNRSSQ